MLGSPSSLGAPAVSTSVATVQEDEVPKSPPSSSSRLDPGVAAHASALPTGRDAPATDPLVAEIALIDGARRALLRNDSGEALGLLNRHQREYPAGRLRPEAFVLRLEAMVRAGRADAARDLARKYLEKQPNGPHAESIRKIAGE